MALLTRFSLDISDFFLYIEGARKGGKAHRLRCHYQCRHEEF